MAAAEQALQPAWAALDASLHKQERDGTPAFLRQFDAGEQRWTCVAMLCCAWPSAFCMGLLPPG